LLVIVPIYGLGHDVADICFGVIYYISLLLLLPLIFVSFFHCIKKNSLRVPTATILLGLMSFFLLLTFVVYSAFSFFKIFPYLCNPHLAGDQYASANIKYPFLVFAFLSCSYFVFFTVSLFLYRLRHLRFLNEEK
jgi:hypothetical protein